MLYGDRGRILFAERLRRELELWVEDGLVSPEQAAAIGGRYRDDDTSERRSQVVQTLAVIGAVVAGLGVILFFAANWDAIARPVRVALLLAALVGSYTGGYYLRDVRGSRPRVGHALLLLGGLVFGASLFLVGQMYHVQAHDPLALLAWALGAGATAAIVRSSPLASLALLSFGGWLAFELAEIGPGGDEALAYFPVLSVLYGAALYALGTAFGRRLRPLGFRGPMRGLGFVLAALGAFVFTFRAVFDAFDDREPLGTGVSLALVAMTAAAAAAIGALAVARERATGRWEAGALAGALALVVLVLVAPESTRSGSDLDGGALVYPLLFNVLLAALALGAILVGYANDEVWLVNMGIAWVAIDVVARYVDVFWELLPRSFVFLGVGVLMLALAFVLERQRTRLVARMEER